MGKVVAKLDPVRTRFQLKVTLLDIQPAIWRRLLVPAKIKLPKLHSVLQIAFGWTDSHLHAFRVGDDSYEAYYPDTWEEPGEDGERHDESEFRLCDLLHSKRDRLLYEYDFGDSWQHEIRIEQVVMLLPGENAAAVSCVAGERAAPPEDCGSYPGYYQLVEAMADPKHPARHDLLEWLGGPYNPEAFDLDAINARLTPRKRRRTV